MLVFDELRSRLVMYGGRAGLSWPFVGSSAPLTDAWAVNFASNVYGDWEAVATSDERSRRETSSVVAAYLSWHLERGLRSLTHVDR